MSGTKELVAWFRDHAWSLSTLWGNSRKRQFIQSLGFELNLIFIIDINKLINSVVNKLLLSPPRFKPKLMQELLLVDNKSRNSLSLNSYSPIENFNLSLFAFNFGIHSNRAILTFLFLVNSDNPSSRMVNSIDQGKSSLLSRSGYLETIF